MEIEIPFCSDGVAREVLVRSTDRVSGTYVTEDDTLYAPNQDSVFDVWRVANEYSQDESLSSEVQESAAKIASYIDELFDER